MRILALDVGERRIGVAISSPEGRLSLPLTVIPRRGNGRDIEAVRTLVEAEGIERVIVGLPLSLSGERSAQTKQIEMFITRLQTGLPVPVEVWDERLSSVEAQRLRREMRPSRRTGRTKAARKGEIDALAAAIILQSYLDSRRQE